MQCERAEELYSDYIEETLSPAMRQVFEQHLSSCSSCAKDVEELRGVFAMLSEDLPMVEVPPGFRANILNAIREQPVHASMLDRLRSWVFDTGGGTNRAPAMVSAAAAVILAVGVGSFMHSHPTTTAAPPPSVNQAGLSPWEADGVSVQDQNGILQKIKTYSSTDGNTYHVFGLHLAGGGQPVNADVYVLQSIAALSGGAALNDSQNATSIWSGSVEPGTTVQVPVAVSSSVPAGSSMSVLVNWTDAAGAHSEVGIVPLSAPAAGQRLVVDAGEPMYQALQAVSVGYNTPLIVDADVAPQLSTPVVKGLDSTDTTVNDALGDLIYPANMTFRQQTDNTYFVDSD